MAATTILSLPTELLDRIYSYTDWDHSSSLYPSRPDILNISLTCRQLRQSILPRIFQNVILKLRWVDGALIEPSLFRLRRDQPHLAKHVRFVYIQTEFSQYFDPEFKMNGFVVPEGLSDWVNPSNLPDDESRPVELLHRQRVNTVARSLFANFQYSDVLRECPNELGDRIKTFVLHIFGHPSFEPDQSGPNESIGKLGRATWPGNDVETRRGIATASTSSSGAPQVQDHLPGRIELFPDEDEAGVATPSVTKIRQRRQLRDMKLRLDALVLVMLCIPASVNALAFEAHPRGHLDGLRNTFVLRVVTMALKIFGSRLQELAMITSPPQVSPTHQPGDGDSDVEESNIISGDVLSELTKVRKLMLSDYGGHEVLRYRELTHESQIQWNDLGATVTHLGLWNIQIDYEQLLRLIKSFTQLEDLTLKNVMLDDQRLSPQRARTHANRSYWPLFLFDIRRHMPTLNLHLAHLKVTWSDSQTLPEGAVQWLQKEAVYLGCVIDSEREQRLLQDFESFIPLWYAEASERGGQAREAHKDGRLVDEAMTSRWKTFANLR